MWGVRRPALIDIAPGNILTRNECTNTTTGAVSTVAPNELCATGTALTRAAIAPFRESFLGDTPSPRLSIGFGVNWNSPFGPFRIDIAHALLSEPGDDTKLFSFNVGVAY